MFPTRIEPRTRVRCVDAKGAKFLDAGSNYTVVFDACDMIFVVGGRTSGGTGRYGKRRFKPIIRVKARTEPSLSVLVQRAVAAFDAMSPAEQEAQRESWVRGEMALSKAGL